MTYSNRAAEALQMMFELHQQQTRKGSEAPYITHLLGVASLVGEYGGDEDQFIAALLHDAVEDQGGLDTLERIRGAFGGRVADLVLGSSDAHTKPKPPWRERKVQHIARQRNAPPDLRLIVAADKLHNARSVLADLRQHGPVVWDRFNGKRDGSLWYYREMLGALRQGWSHPILADLQVVVDNLHALSGEEAPAPGS